MKPIVADMVWPALFIEQRLFSFWAIGFGLVIEYLFVRALTDLSVRQAIAADVTMNATSSLLGIFLIPLVGLAWELTGGLVLNNLLHLGTFNPIGWLATIVLAGGVNSAVETGVLRFIFGQRPAGKIFRWLWLANGITVALTFASFFIVPPSDHVSPAGHAIHRP